MKAKHLLFSLLLLLTSCGGSSVNKNAIIDESLLTKEAPREVYDNSFTKDKIPNYWDAYGCGDPFVMRYNGMYYLYVSTKVEYTGVMAWKSEDLINWEQCTGEGLPTGFVSVDDATYTAYAPEVTYYNGYFYMCESRRGKGHYFLKSLSPEGPFVSCSDNLGESIDGSFFIDDNEKIYFLRASNAGIRVVEATLDEDHNLGLNKGENRQLNDTQIGNWTEGPHLFKKDGFYYLTYTGTNVISSAYRVGYSYHKETATGSFFSSQAFTYGNILTLNTSDEFNGLGHSSNVMGPNMDSYYIVYHDLVAVTGPYRHYNLSRIMFNGSEISINHPELHNNLVPQMPEFYTHNNDGLSVNGAYELSDLSSSSRFTAEFNATGTEQKYVFSYIDDSHYNYLWMSENNELSFHTVDEDGDKVNKTVKMVNDYDYSKNHTYRVAHDDGKITVFFDTMKKMDFVLDSSLKGGKIGYQKNINHGFTAFSNHAYDSSMRADYKQDSALADTYDEEISVLDKDSFISMDKMIDGNGYQDGHALRLNKKGERATYKLYNDKDGVFGVDITVPCDQMGKKVGLRIDNEPIREYTISKYSVDDDLVKVHLGNIEMSKGVHYISLYYVGNDVTFTKIDWYQTTSKVMTFEHDLSTFVTNGAIYVNTWKIKQGGHYALSGNRQLIYFGDSRLRDYCVEVDVAFDGETNASTAGICLRCSNPSFSVSDDVNSIQGFYCGFNLTKSFITECNYNQTYIGVSSALSFESGTFYHLKAEVRGNEVKFYINNDLSLELLTSLGPTHGQAALYTNGAAAIYKNLVITTY